MIIIIIAYHCYYYVSLCHCFSLYVHDKYHPVEPWSLYQPPWHDEPRATRNETQKGSCDILTPLLELLLLDALVWESWESWEAWDGLGYWKKPGKRWNHGGWWMMMMDFGGDFTGVLFWRDDSWDERKMEHSKMKMIKMMKWRVWGKVAKMECQENARAGAK